MLNLEYLPQALLSLSSDSKLSHQPILSYHIWCISIHDRANIVTQFLFAFIFRRYLELLMFRYVNTMLPYFCRHPTPSPMSLFIPPPYIHRSCKINAQFKFAQFA